MSERDLISNLRKLREAVDPELQHLVEGFDYLEAAPEDVELFIPAETPASNDTIFKRLEHSAWLEDILGLSPEVATKAAHEAFPDPRPISSRLMSKNGAASHRRRVQGFVDAMRTEPPFSRIADSEGWGSLVNSATNYVEQQIEALGT